MAEGPSVTFRKMTRYISQTHGPGPLIVLNTLFRENIKWIPMLGLMLP